MSRETDAMGHIEMLIDEPVRDKLGISNRRLDTQVLRLCGGFNDLQSQLDTLKAIAALHDELVKALRHFCKRCGDADPTKDCDMCKTAILLAKAKEIT